MSGDKAPLIVFTLKKKRKRKTQQLDHTWRGLNSNVCNVKDLLTEAFKSEAGPGCRERGIVGNRGSFVPGQPCWTHV